MAALNFKGRLPRIARSVKRPYQRFSDYPTNLQHQFIAVYHKIAECTDKGVYLVGKSLLYGSTAFEFQVDGLCSSFEAVKLRNLEVAEGVEIRREPLGAKTGILLKFE